ncbi:PLP-dependent aminotransferase family protein [Oceanobacillus sp. HCA-5259]|uniref:MocR-like transcriptional regulator GabR n=1 Tax=Oceanobacillus sp. HCA-5259 TaxID=3134661 RepID=UPI0030C23AB0
MMLIKVDRDNTGKHIYQQIYLEMKKSILANKLAPGEKLPSKRKLAQELGVSNNSVTNAYEQLLAEGYIYTVERKGYYVEDIKQFMSLQEFSMRPDFPDDLKEKETSEDDKESWISLSHMSTDLSIFPFKAWMKCERMAIKHHKKELSEISHPQGPYLVRQTIARLIAVSRGVMCEPEQVIIGPGTQPLLWQIMNMLPSGITTAIENPGYSRLYQQLKDTNHQVAPISLDDKGINVKEVKELNPNLLIITPSHQFPTGIIMPISKRMELLNWAVNQENTYIIEDDYDSEFKYGTDNIPSLQSLDRHQRVIYTGTFSKTMMPGLRVSYFVLPPALLREYRRKYSSWIQGSNVLSLYTLHYFIETGEYAKHIKRMNNSYEEKRELLVEELKRKFKKDIHIKDIRAGLHFLAEFKTNKTYEEVAQLAKNKKLELYPLTRFMLKEEQVDRGNKIVLVLGFANISREEIPEAVERLYEILQED